MDEFATVEEVGAELGVTRSRVHQLMARAEEPCPTPVISKSNGRIQLWDMREVRKWAKKNGYPRRPRGES